MFTNQIEKTNKDFDLELVRSGNLYVGVCPLHLGADNYSAFNINIDTGRWYCNTHECHKVVENNIFHNFIRALLSRRRDQYSDFNELTLCNDEEVESFCYYNDLEDIYVPSQNNVTYTKRAEKLYDLPLSFLDNKEVGECPYFLERGFSRDILKKHGVFLCRDKDKPLFGWNIVPIFDPFKTKIIGTTCRTSAPKCIVCCGFHRPSEPCLEKIDIIYNPKWKHQPYGFLSNNHLYNIWNSWRFIKFSDILIVVESPGNVWKLEQCGFLNSIATFGSRISDQQIKLIEKLNPRKIISIADNDEAGFKLQQNINEIFNEREIINIAALSNDIADLEDDLVRELIWNHTIN